MLKVLIAGAHSVASVGMGVLVLGVSRKAVLHFCKSYAETKRQLADLLIDLIIIDLGIPGSKGAVMIDEFRKIRSDVKILIFSERDESLHAPEYLHMGANGYISKNSSSEETQKALRTLIGNKRYISDKLSSQINSAAFGKRKVTLNPIEMLTAREREVFDLLLSGKSTKEIAAQLGKKYPTISTHKSAIFRKLDVDNVVDMHKKVELIYGKLEIHG